MHFIPGKPALVLEDALVVGDLKHSISMINPQEAREIPMFISALFEKAEVQAVLGNHDGGLKPYLGRIETHGPRGFIYKKPLLFHGNAKPLPEDVENSSRMVASHWHPIYEFKSPIGGRMTEKIWVGASAFGKPLLIMPSFNGLLGGHPA